MWGWWTTCYPPKKENLWAEESNTEGVRGPWPQRKLGTTLGCLLITYARLSTQRTCRAGKNTTSQLNCYSGFGFLAYDCVRNLCRNTSPHLIHHKLIMQAAAADGVEPQEYWMPCHGPRQQPNKTSPCGQVLAKGGMEGKLEGQYSLQFQKALSLY